MFYCSTFPWNEISELSGFFALILIARSWFTNVYKPPEKHMERKYVISNHWLFAGNFNHFAVQVFSTWKPQLRPLPQSPVLALQVFALNTNDLLSSNFICLDVICSGIQFQIWDILTTMQILIWKKIHKF